MIIFAAVDDNKITATGNFNNFYRLNCTLRQNPIAIGASGYLGKIRTAIDGDKNLIRRDCIDDVGIVGVDRQIGNRGRKFIKCGCWARSHSPGTHINFFIDRNI